MRKCIILLPLAFNDGKEVPSKLISQILREIDEVFDGHHIAGTGQGSYRMKNGEMAHDTTLDVWIAFNPDKREVLKKMVGRFARMLKQETIYFEDMDSVVEFIKPEPENESEGA